MVPISWYLQLLQYRNSKQSYEIVICEHHRLNDLHVAATTSVNYDLVSLRVPLIFDQETPNFLVRFRSVGGLGFIQLVCDLF